MFLNLKKFQNFPGPNSYSRNFQVIKDSEKKVPKLSRRSETARVSHSNICSNWPHLALPAVVATQCEARLVTQPIYIHQQSHLVTASNSILTADWVHHNVRYYVCMFLFFSRPRSEGGPHALSPFIPVLCHSD